MGDQALLPVLVSGSVCQNTVISMKYFGKMIEEIIYSVSSVSTTDFPEYCQSHIAVSCCEMKNSFVSVKDYIELCNAKESRELEILTYQLGRSEIELTKTNQCLKTIEVNISEHDREIKKLEAKQQESEASIKETERKITELEDKKDRGRGGQAATVGATVLGGIIFPPSLWVTVPAAAVTIAAIEEEISRLSQRVKFQRSEKEECNQNIRKKQKDIDNLRNRKEECYRNLNEAKEKNKTLVYEIDNAKRDINSTSDLLVKVRRVCTSVEKVYGAMKVVNQETRNAYTWEPIVFPMKELFNYMKDLVNTFPLETRVEIDKTLLEIQALTRNLPSIESFQSDSNNWF